MSQQQNEKPTHSDQQLNTVAISLIGGIAVGIAIGVAIGLALGNLALGIGVGIAIGSGIGGAGLALSTERTWR